jgi:hypothetical protein
MKRLRCHLSTQTFETTDVYGKCCVSTLCSDHFSGNHFQVYEFRNVNNYVIVIEFIFGPTKKKEVKNVQFRTHGTHRRQRTVLRPSV